MNSTTGETSSTAAEHWNTIYRANPGHSGSWFQSSPETSLRLMDAAGVDPEHSVVDVGGGESRLIDRLLERGFADLTVLDVSSTALDTTRRRLGAAAARVRWDVQDILAWHPGRRYDVWHDRAVFHFLTSEWSRAGYLSALDAALEAGGRVIVATFAADGPEHCSGLPVARYSPDALAARFDDRFRVLSTQREQHHTPAGAVQPFSWVALAKQDGNPR